MPKPQSISPVIRPYVRVEVTSKVTVNGRELFVLACGHTSRIGPGDRKKGTGLGQERRCYFCPRPQ